MQKNIMQLAHQFMAHQQVQQNINLKMVQTLVDFANCLPVDAQQKLGKSIQQVLDEVIAKQEAQKILFDNINNQLARRLNES